MAEEKLSVGDLDRILIAGAFGSTLDIGRAVLLGLIPAADPARIEFVGNVSLTGAKMLLISENERKRCERLAAKVRHRSLARGEEFQKVFVESLKFEKWK